MPGENGMGPMGTGPMTGRKLGKCNPQENNTGQGRGLGQGFGRGQGRGLGQGFGRGQGRGLGRGLGQGLGRSRFYSNAQTQQDEIKPDEK